MNRLACPSLRISNFVDNCTVFLERLKRMFEFERELLNFTWSAIFEANALLSKVLRTFGMFFIFKEIVEILIW